MNDLSGPAIVRGVVDPGSKGSVRFTSENSRQVFNVPIATDATFRAAVPQGQYRVEYGAAATSLTALAAGNHSVDLRRNHAISFHVSSTVASQSDLVIHAVIEGAGRHTFSIRACNLNVSNPAEVTVDLGAHNHHEITWQAHVRDKSTPWVVVVLKDGVLSGHAELTGIR